MAQPKVDGVIEAVRYSTDGQIDLARVYERRGPIWSDRLLWDRKKLTETLKKGRRFVTGQRRLYMGSEFDFANPVHLNGQNIVTKDRAGGRDNLTGIPVF